MLNGLKNVNMSRDHATTAPCKNGRPQQMGIRVGLMAKSTIRSGNPERRLKAELDLTARLVVQSLHHDLAVHRNFRLVDTVVDHKARSLLVDCILHHVLHQNQCVRLLNLDHRPVYSSYLCYRSHNPHGLYGRQTYFSVSDEHGFTKCPQTQCCSCWSSHLRPRRESQSARNRTLDSDSYRDL